MTLNHGSSYPGLLRAEITGEVHPELRGAKGRTQGSVTSTLQPLLTFWDGAG